MSPQFRSLVKRTSLTVVVLALLFTGLRIVLNYQRPCEPPCRPLRPAGKKIIKEPWGERVVYLPQQQPLELTLELDKPSARAKIRFTLHYKVAVHNLSDSIINTVRADFFMEQTSLASHNGFYFKIWDPSGRNWRRSILWVKKTASSPTTLIWALCRKMAATSTWFLARP